MVLGLRHTRLLIASILVAGLVLVAPFGAVASAQADGPAVFSSCTASRHSGAPAADPVFGNVVNSPSIWILVMWLTGVFPDAIVEIKADGASGPVTGYGVVVLGGYVIVEIPAFSFGSHRVTSLTVDGVDVATDITHNIDESEAACDQSTIAAPPPPTTSTTSTSTTTTSTTTSTTTTSTTTTTTTTTTAAPPVSEVTITKDIDKASPKLWNGLIIASGLITAAGAGLLVSSRGEGKGPCDELRASWKSAQDACDQARARAAEAERAAAAAEQRQRELEAELKALERKWPGLRDGEGPGSAELPGVPGSRITSRDLALRRQFAGQAWDDYQADPNPETAAKLEQEWEKLNTPEFQAELRAKEAEAQAQATELEAQIAQASAEAARARADADAAHAAADAACARAAAARSSLDECEAAAAAPDEPTSGGPSEPEGGDEPPGESSTGSTGTGPTTTDPGGTGEGSPRPGDPCTDGEKQDPVLIAEFSRKCTLDFSVFVIPESGREVERAEQFAVEFGEIAKGLNTLGSALGAGGNIATAAAGNYVKGAADAAIGGAKGEAGITSIPTSPASIITTSLEWAASFASLVSRKLAQWLKPNELYTVKVAIFMRQVTVRYEQQLECKGGSWRCERTLQTVFGPVVKEEQEKQTRTHKEVPGTVKSFTRSRSQDVARDAKDLAEFIEQHKPGPC